MELALNQIQQGDCIELLNQVAAGSVDLVFADPPFNIGYDYDEYDDRREADDYLAWSRRWIEGVHRVLKPHGTFWLAIGDEYAAELKVLCTRELGFHCRSWVIWFYTFGVHCKYKFTRSHAHLFYFVRDAKHFTFNSLAVRVPSARELVYGDKRADPDGRMPDDTWMMAPVLPPEVPTRDGFTLRPQDIPERFPPESDVWFFSRVAGTFKERRGWHGCQMPEQLLGRIIKACSNEGDLVLDPFAGSGTTPAVAKKLGRQYLGFELSKKYARQAERRLAGIKVGDPPDGPEHAARSAPPTIAGRRLDRMNRDKGRKSGQSPSRRANRRNRSVRDVAVNLGEVNTALTKAFLASSEGYAIDRIIADPRLNAAYLRACQDLHVPLLPRECNCRLLGLRKSGKLTTLPRPRKTIVAWETLEPFAFASEIAWQILAERGHSLDDILCDPKLVTEFDGIAARFQPGYEPFDYRWAALTWRKKAHERRACAARRKPPDDLRRRLRRRRADHLDPTDAPAVEGLYAIWDDKQCLYIGETTNLQTRIQTHCRSLDAFNLIPKDDTPIVFAAAPFPGPQERRWGVHSRLLGLLSPRLNDKKQAYVARSNRRLEGVH